MKNLLTKIKDKTTRIGIIICVPTPLTAEKEPDLSYIKSACETIARILRLRLRRGQFVIIQLRKYQRLLVG